MDTPNCKDCRYRICLARLVDVHVEADDCDKYGTEFCERMNDPDFIEFMKKGGADNG